MRASISRISWDAFKASQSERRRKRLFTLSHGDFHPANFIRRTGHDTSLYPVVLLDFEVIGVGSGPQDLSQYLISHMDPIERRKCERELVQTYYDELVRLGVNHVTFEWVWREFALGGSARWVWLLAVLSQMCPSEMVKYWARNLEEFLVDHGIDEASIEMPRV